MSPIHVSVWLSALTFQLINATCIGGYLASYGPLTTADWAGRAVYIELGMMLFFLGLAGNIYHYDDLREIRRAAARKMKRRSESKGEGNGKG